MGGQQDIADRYEGHGWGPWLPAAHSATHTNGCRSIVQRLACLTAPCDGAAADMCIALPSCTSFATCMQGAIMTLAPCPVHAGDFHSVRSENDGCCSCCWHPPAAPQQQPWQGMQGGSMRHVVEALANGLSTAGLCAQGLLGGLSLLVLAMTYIVYAGSPMTAFLQYYGPLALVVNRWGGCRAQSFCL